MAQPPADRRVLELRDTSTHALPAEFLLEGRGSRTPERIAGRLARQFLEQNRGILRDFSIEGHVGYDGRRVTLELTTGTRVGALPLLSPTTGRPDYGLVVRPRYEWLGIGRMLARTGWKVLPTILRLPELPRSDRKVPPWVISSVVLRRIRELLDHLGRRFAMVERDRSAPRGQVRWGEYATRRMPRARFLEVPCRHPELRSDRTLLQAIHYTLRKHRAALARERGGGPVVSELLELAEKLLRRVGHVQPRRPSGTRLDRWARRPLRTEAFQEGLRAIEWTVDDRGLAGLGDREGLAWVLPMEEFFEAWAELLAERHARRHGGAVRRGRRRETVVPISWDPPYVGSQSSLVPDLVIERPDRAIVVDAKYKSHWEDLELRGWNALRDHVRARHRHDLLQVLAYANLPAARRVTACLLYPCRASTWASLGERGRRAHRAEVAAGERTVEVVLGAVPMGVDPGEVSFPVAS